MNEYELSFQLKAGGRGKARVAAFSEHDARNILGSQHGGADKVRITGGRRLPPQGQDRR